MGRLPLAGSDSLVQALVLVVTLQFLYEAVYQPSMDGNNDDDDDDDDDGADDGNDEDPGEGTKRKATSSASGRTDTSEELIADEGGMPSPTKRGAEARGSTEPSPTRIRVEESPAVVQERPELVPKVNKVKLPEPGFTDSEAEDMRANAKIRTLSDDDPMSESSTSSEFRARIRRVCSLKSIKDVENKFLKKDQLRYNEDEEVDAEEFEGLEAEIQRLTMKKRRLKTMTMSLMKPQMKKCQRGRMSLRKDR